MTNPMQIPQEPMAAPVDTAGDEAMSALFDGELADERARVEFKRLIAGAEARARFAEYAMIGDALRGVSVDRPDLTRRVMRALDDEPTVLAPMRRPRDRRPALWLAAATVAAITWVVWQADPRQDVAVPMAVAPAPAQESLDANAYLAAHQDFAQAVVAAAEMRFTRVSLAGGEQ